ncbi:MAG: hypothetical protein IJB97_06835, partial [Clostridia bacterium]|nr:hypothetical protein [Clostridia bacterium]
AGISVYSPLTERTSFCQGLFCLFGGGRGALNALMRRNKRQDKRYLKDDKIVITYKKKGF